MFDLYHLRDRNTGRVGSVDSGSDQHVAVLDIRAGRHVAQRQLAGIARAKHDGAQSVAQHLNRHRLILFGDQCHFGEPGVDARDLADDTDIIHHDLPELYIGIGTLVDQNLAPEYIAFGVNDLSQLGFELVADRQRIQTAQMQVFLFQCLQLQQLSGVALVLLLQFVVLPDQFVLSALGDEEIAGLLPQCVRHGRQPLDR